MPGHGCRGGHHDHHRHHDHHDDEDDGPGVSMQNLNPYFGRILLVTFYQMGPDNVIPPQKSILLLSSFLPIASPAPLPQKPS